MASIGNPVLAMQNPNWSTLLPGRNPTGSQGAGVSSVPSTGSNSGQNPVLPPTNLPPGAPASNPYGVSSIPTFGANTGGYTTTSLLPSGSGSTPGSSPSNILSGMSSADIKRLHDELGNTFGNGVAAAIMNFLLSGAGFNQNAINNIFAALQPGFERAQQNLLQEFGASGNRFGSSAQIGLADLASQEQLNLGEIEAQMYEQSINDALTTLLGISKGTETTLANSPSVMDTLTSALPIIGQGAQGLSESGIGGTPGNILDIIARLGGA